MTKTISRTCILGMLSLGVTAYAQTTGQQTPTQPASQAGSQRMEQGRQPGDRSQTEQQITLVGCIQRETEYRTANQGGRGGAMGTGIGAGNEFVLINASMGSGSGSQTAMSGSPDQTTGSTATGTSGTATSGTAATTGSATGSTSGTGTSGTASGTASTSPSSTSPGSTASHTQHSGMSMASGGTAYALTGDREKDLEQYVGQRVEIIGRLEGGADRAGASGSGYSGTTGSTASGSGTSATGTTSGTGSATVGGTTTGVDTTTGASATGSRTGSGTSGSGSATGSASAQAQGRSVGDLKEVDVVSFRAIGGSCSSQQ